MILLGVLIIGPTIAMLIFTVRCAAYYNGTVCTHNWGFREWLADTIPVLVAVLMRNSGTRPPPDE